MTIVLRNKFKILEEMPEKKFPRWVLVVAWILVFVAASDGIILSPSCTVWTGEATRLMNGSEPSSCHSFRLCCWWIHLWLVHRVPMFKYYLV